MLGASCRRKMLTTDASLTGWGAISEGRSSQGLWKDHHLSWHINRLDMLAVFLALKNFLTDLRGHHVLVRSDNTSVVSYINHQGGLRSRPLCKLACQILLWKLLSLRATCIPGAHNIGADILSRQGLRPGEWRLHPEVVELIWKEFGQAQVDLFASRETSHCPLWFMTHMWPRLHLSAFPPIALLPGVLERVHQDRVPLLLIAPRWPGRVWFPNLFSLLDGHPLELPVRRDLLSQAGGLDISPPSRTMETVGLASEGAQLINSGLSTEVVETILHSRAPSTRKLYALKWKVFASWCSDHQLDPVNCPVGTVLEFLQDRFTAGLAPSTLNVYVAAILLTTFLWVVCLWGMTPWYLFFLRGT